MNPRGILFSGPMVRAILDGRKTQTRRIVDMRDIGHIGPGGSDTPDDWGYWVESDGVGGWAVLARGYDRLREQHGCVSIPAPYGPVGRELWLRETWACSDELLYQCDRQNVVYRADVDNPFRPPIFYGDKWRPSIHMPRWASRVSLTVTGIRVERLQDISEEDARAEGVEPDHGSPPGFMANVGGVSVDPTTYRGAYAMLWDELHGAGSWAANPWVWAYTFEVRRGG